MVALIKSATTADRYSIVNFLSIATIYNKAMRPSGLTERFSLAAIALRIKSDSMESELVVDHIVVVNSHTEVKQGDYVIAKNDDGAATSRQLKKYGEVFVFHPLNSKYNIIALRV